MSTQSATGFEWSVKLIGTSSFYVGIASKLEARDSYIQNLDRNAIIYCSNADFSTIKIGSNTVHSNLTKHKNEDVIRFRFQPHAKKLVIDLVRF